MPRIEATCAVVLLTIRAVAVGQTQVEPPQSKTTAAPKRGYLGMGGGFNFYSKTVLLMQPAVQQEIQLTDEQQKRLKEIDEEHERAEERIGKQFETRRAELIDRGASREDLSALAKEASALRSPLIAKAEDARVKVLDPPQRTRLEQIQIQLEGPMTFRRPVIQSRLNLSPGQIEAIDAIVSQGREELIKATALPPELMRRYSSAKREQLKELADSKDYLSAVEDSRKTATRVRDRTTEMILKLLTRRQRERYQAMLGEPFDRAQLRSDRPAAPVPASSEPGSVPSRKTPA